jgi:hypothetical protein
VIYGLVAGAYTVGIFLLSQFGSDKLQKEARLGFLIPRLPAWVWLTIALFLLLLLLMIGFEGTVREFRDIRAKHEDEQKRLRAGKEAALADQQSGHDAAIAAERTEYQLGLADQRAKHQDALSDQQSRHEAAIAAERAKRDALRKRLREEQDRSYEENRPVLKGRIVPWPGQDSFKYCLQVKIMSPRPVSGIFVWMPGNDPRFGLWRRDIEARRFGSHHIFRPGEWITVGGVKIPPSQAEKIMGCSMPETVTVWAKCWDENRIDYWEDIVVDATFELAGSVHLGAA